MNYVKLGTKDIKHIVNLEETFGNKKYTMCGLDITGKFMNQVSPSELLKRKHEFCSGCYRDTVEIIKELLA